MDRESIESRGSEGIARFANFITSPIKYVPWLLLIDKDIANEEITSFRSHLPTVTGHKQLLMNSPESCKRLHGH